MRTICLSKPVSELVLQTGLTRPQSWTEEVSDLGRGLFSFAFQHKYRPLPAGNGDPQISFKKMICLSIINYFDNLKKILWSRNFLSYAKVIIHNNWLHRIFLNCQNN
jgi:hypothetical protein